MHLTDISVRALPVPSKGQKTYFDDALPSFGCRISQGGTRAFVVQSGADRQLMTIGRYPVVSLAEARAEAKRLLAERTLGRHRPQAIAWDDAVALFFSACEQKNKPRTVRDYKRLLKRHFAFGRKRLSEISPQDVNRKLDKLLRVGSEQNHALVAVKVFFRWAQRRRYIEHSPCEGMQTSKRPSRDRVLSDRELAAIFRAATSMGYPFGPIVKLCILTGQRRSEIAWLRRSYFEKDTLTVPALLAKNRRQHTMPVGSMAREVVKGIPHQDDLLFPAQRGEKVFGGWSKQKAALDTRIANEGHRMPTWTLHDLRRTFATNLAALGVRLEVIERLLNHVSGSLGGLVAIYQKHNWMPEMRDAIIKWENCLAALLAKSEGCKQTSSLGRREAA
jgi:integrase